MLITTHHNLQTIPDVPSQLPGPRIRRYQACQGPVISLAECAAGRWFQRVVCSAHIYVFRANNITKLSFFGTKKI